MIVIINLGGDDYITDANQKEIYAKQSGYSSLADMTKQYGVEPTFKFGTKPGDVSLVTGKPYNFAGQSSTPDGGPAFASWDDWVNNLDASRESGWGGGTITKSELDAAEKAHNDRVARGVQGYSGKFDRTKAEKHMAILQEKYGKEDDKDKSKVKDPSVIGSGKTDITSKIKETPTAGMFSPDAGDTAPDTSIPTGIDNYSTQDNIYSSFQDTTPQVDYSNDGDSGDPGGDSGSGGSGGDSSDMGFSTASGGFIQRKNLPKANKKKQGGLASRR